MFLVLQSGLEKNFESVLVSVVDCPDLTQKPFNLSAKGMAARELKALCLTLAAVLTCLS